jgi:uncharacterized protein involved in exopolysaccharide biosynthesis
MNAVEDERVSLSQVLYVLVGHRRVIALATAGALVVSAAISLVLPKWYTAVSTILPPESGTSQPDIVGIMRYAGYQPAYLPTITSPTDVYAAVLRSHRVTSAVVDSLDLAAAYGVGSKQKALGRLIKHTDISITQEGLVKIEYEDRDRARSAEVANFMVRELDRFNRDSRITTARRVREFIEQRIADVAAELESAETDLKEFKEATGAILISEQSKASIETAADIYGKIAELEVGLERLGQFATDRSPEVIDLRAQIRALERKLGEMGYMESGGADSASTKLFPRFSNAPDLEKRLAGLLREVEIKRSVYRVLSEQYEEARIQEMKKTSTVQVLDWAHPPMVRSQPKRKAIVSVSGVFAFLLASFMVFYRHRIQREALPDPRDAVTAVSKALRDDLRVVRRFFAGSKH